MKLRLPGGFFSKWYKRHGRSFPWRAPHTDPFGVLVAEILLRQTRAEMVPTVWQSLMKQYPDPASLAAADPREIGEMVQELGLGRQRTQALIQLAAAVVEAGGTPSDLSELLELPHVGVYSAHAVACFAFGKRMPVVDLNVVRVLCRLVGLPRAPDIRRAKDVWRISWEVLPKSRVREHNYGLLDFAAQVCRSRNPLCNTCPLAVSCAYFKASTAIDGTARNPTRRARRRPRVKTLT